MLEDRLKRFIDLGVPGAIACIRDEKGVVRAAAAGRTVGVGARPARTDDAWRVGSVTKLITAAVVLQLAAEGRLSIDDPLAGSAGVVVRHSEVITIRQLLDHTAGVPDYLTAPDFPWQVSAQAVAAHLHNRVLPTERVAQAEVLTRPGPPGSMHHYSNTNYLLLGLIIESATGLRYEQAVQQRVIDRFNLQRTLFPGDDGRVPVPDLGASMPADLPGRPFADRHRLLDVTRRRMFPTADGGLISDATDLLGLLDALVSGELLGGGRSAFEAAVTPGVTSPDGDYRYGLGVMIVPVPTSRGHTAFGHDGEDLGTYTSAFSDGTAGGRALVLGLNTTIELRPELEDEVDQLLDDVMGGALR